MQIFVYDINVPLAEKELAIIPPLRRERAKRYLKQEDRQRCLAGGFLLARFLGIEKDDMLRFGKNGKPLLATIGQNFNLSHSGDYVVLAVADCEVGVDIEKIGPYFNEIANKCYTQNECLWLKSQGTDVAFFKLWTAKESVMKASGLGFEMEPQSFSVLPIAPGKHQIKGRSWQLYWLEIKGHMLCLAAESVQEEIDVIRV